MSYGSLVDYESQRIRTIVLSPTVAELYLFMKCVGSCQFLRGIWMDLSGEVANIHMRTDAKNLVTTARTIRLPEQKETIHMISTLRKEACSGSIHDLAHILTQNCSADFLTKVSAKGDNLITAVKTGELLEVEKHPNFRTLMEHKAFLSTSCRTFMHTGEKDVFFQNALMISLAPTPQEGPFHVMFVKNQHTQEPKEPNVCDRNHLFVSVTVPARPALKRDRDLELTQPHFAAQIKTFEHEDQNAAKITSAPADSCIQSPWPVMSISVRTLCLCLVLMTIFLSVINFSFFPSFATMSSSKPIGVRRVNRWTRNPGQRREDHYYEALAFSRHNIVLVFDEEKMQPEQTHKGARKCRY